MALLMQDPAFRSAWTNLRQAVFALDLEDPEAGCAAINDAVQFVEATIDSRPELAAMAEATEATSH